MTHNKQKSSSTDLAKELVEPAAGLGEVILDHALQEGVLKEIPALGTLLGLVNLWKNLREYHLQKKIRRFVEQLRDISEADKEAFAKKLEEDKKYSERVFENLLLVLDQLDHLDKAQMIGRAFKALIQDRITTDDFTRIASAVNRTFLPDLQLLKQQVDRKAHAVALNGEEEDEWVQRLSFAGFMRSTNGVAPIAGPAPIHYSINRLGELTAQICMSELSANTPD